MKIRREEASRYSLR